MIGGLIAGIIVFMIVAFALGFGLDVGWGWNIGAKILFYVVLFLIIVGICFGLGVMIDTISSDRFIGTWEMTKANYEQAMSAYSDYESIIKDNPELIKAKELLEQCKERVDGNYAYTCEKCATVFGYYGDLEYQKILESRSRSINERT